MRTFILALSRGQTRLEDLVQQQSHSVKEVIRAETMRSQHIVAALVTLESAKVCENIMNDRNSGPPMWQRREKLLRSLKYDSMNDRIDQISETHEGTYQWIIQGVRPWIAEIGDDLDEGASQSHFHPDCSPKTAVFDVDVSWNCFRCWTQSITDDIYWIQGKAGSGKSTLMKFLTQESENWSTQQSHLQRPPLVLTHFLWAAGLPIQRSI
ncbi:hypothetical protein B0T26DRAFT_296344 [Lasiosphaeria miniovina]|uniref:Nephrocystin 3-like N-terminal domain-containing protein n=1 Tax=Lasiosphaeria miniovina TaxID=1954250 RepID=A0AA40AKF4_9PEZI|nr:uncharacterized protein B0T26DRAFT_296344 [Lasiosphaeria miniovina]KAK0717405.1 hypothetical protein B0T26DRAFT_296344 [Lasiosphaeria miniovina]